MYKITFKVKIYILIFSENVVFGVISSEGHRKDGLVFARLLALAQFDVDTSCGTISEHLIVTDVTHIHIILLFDLFFPFVLLFLSLIFPPILQRF